MTTWVLKCPNCGTDNEVPRKTIDNEVPKQMIVVKCGMVSCTCKCSNCGQNLEDEREYWQWLGLTEPPPAEVEG